MLPVDRVLSAWTLYYGHCSNLVIKTLSLKLGKTIAFWGISDDSVMQGKSLLAVRLAALLHDVQNDIHAGLSDEPIDVKARHYSIQQ